jgi:hypothetical protein
MVHGVLMAHKSNRDQQGTYWIIPADIKETAPIEAWWKREGGHEHLIIRQDDGEKADVILASLGQVYDLIAVLNVAVEEV